MSSDGSFRYTPANTLVVLRHPVLDFIRSNAQNPPGPLLVQHKPNRYVGMLVVAAKLVYSCGLRIVPIRVRVPGNDDLPITLSGLSLCPSGHYALAARPFATSALAEQALGAWISDVFPEHRRPYDGLFDRQDGYAYAA